MPSLEESICLAFAAHVGQKYGDQPYIFHPLRVMMSLETEEERIVGVLHDTLEDSDLTVSQLLFFGYSDSVVEALQCLTRRPEETNKYYFDYIQRIKEGPELARKVKLADLRDNSKSAYNWISSKPLSKDKQYEYERNQKYLKAIKILES